MVGEWECLVWMGGLGVESLAGCQPVPFTSSLTLYLLTVEVPPPLALCAGAAFDFTFHWSCCWVGRIPCS